eukprot:gi/632967871/ref/XP_007900220.1/ PREDICTED: protocadherin gamma-C5-like [Callorhinchus milii]
MRHSDRPWMLRRQVSSIFLLCVWSLVSAQIRYSIPEELKHGAFVGKIASDLGLSTEELSNRRFRIVSDAQTQYLDVNLNNGVLFVNQRIDREQLCGESLPCLLPLEVVIENPVEQYRVEVEVLDINDNSPSFPRNEIILEIAESATAGARFLLESAHDPDVGTNSIRTYQLSPNDHFVLDVQTRGEWILAELILEKPMDRETQSKHQLLLQAFDGGTPERTGTARISIIVLDANDNAPVFERSLYSVSLTEDVPFGTLVIKLNATDLDEGSNGEVVYSFSSYNKERIPELFSIDRKSGEIRVKGILDFEEASFYEISVEARDKGPHPLPAHCTVRVDIKDVNDNTPELALNSVSSTISENAQTGTLVALISVTDRDSNENGNTDCQISPNLPFELKSSFKNSYRLLTNDLLDRENTPEYQVTVTCTDQGSPRLSTKETIAVHISDINDNAPSFPQTSYTVYVTENNAPGTLIGSVTALDPDTEQNSHLTYSVLDTQIEGMPITSYVSINPETGDIYSQHSYDYEQLKHFRIHIQAQDVGPPLLWGNATVNIVILDQNDNTPAIISPKTVKDSQISVPRSAGAGYLATKITATDADSGQNARLFYQLLQATDPSLFTVSHNLGEVKTARRFEDKDSAIQRLVIQVKDRGHPPLSATATVTLTIVEHIGDLSSDFRETHTIPEHSSNLAFYIIISLGAISSILLVVIILISMLYSFSVMSEIYHDTIIFQKYQIRYSIPEGLETGAFVGNIARDFGLDVRKLSDRRFRLISATEKRYFEVNLENGVLFVHEKIDREQLCDQSFPCLLNLEVVMENPLELYRAEVEIQDINDNSPSFSKGELHLEILESIPPGTRFPLQSAHDPDVGINSIRTYRLSSNEHFTLEVQKRSDGTPIAQMILEKYLDREKQRVHHLLLTAVDGGNPERSGSAQVVITVLDVNDNVPAFDNSVYRVSVAENVVENSLVIDLNATDLDEGSNADIIYSFSSHTPDRVRDLFSLEPETGEIRVKGVLDYEKASSYEINVEATNQGANSVPVYCKVLVDILDLNDFKPELTVMSLSSPVPEDAAIGTMIALLSVKDPDSGENGKTSCHLAPNLPFELKSSFENSYMLATKHTLDRETVPHYSINVTCRDGGSPALSTERALLVEISDINDNVPRFEKSSYTAYLMENNAPGSLICTVSARDPDLGQNAHISYSIQERHTQAVPVSSLVSINSDNGNIFSQRSFDYEQLKKIQVYVEAQDAGTPPLSSSTVVNVIVLDQNDNPPTLLSAPAMDASRVTVLRSAQPNSLVTKLAVTDADSGQNAKLFYQLLQAREQKGRFLRMFYDSLTYTFRYTLILN